MSGKLLLPTGIIPFSDTPKVEPSQADSKSPILLLRDRLSIRDRLP
ncbi:hypothetical protein [Roseofilum sp. Guam]|nr:hypothetical protein [Roseofilum sp. Guam]MBP0027728.1 hypothetical protein [Roseofilum sp. Guam]